MPKSLRLSGCPQLLNATSARPIGRGSTGPGVAILQELLSDLGHSLPKSCKAGRWDGIFGVETDAAVRKFQSAKGLAADGLVGPKTLGVLDFLILNNPFLELIDFAQYKADQVTDLVAPAEQRGNAYW